MTTAMDLTDKERAQHRRKLHRIPALVYLRFSPEQKSDHRNAMAALMDFDEEDNWNELTFVRRYVDGFLQLEPVYQVIHDVNLYCPQLFMATTTTASTISNKHNSNNNHHHLQHLLLYASPNVVGSVVMKFRGAIEWNQDLACQAIHRYSFCYQLLPDQWQNQDDILLKALACRINPFEMEHSYLLSKNKEFIMKALQINPWVYARCHARFINDTDVLLQVIGSGDSKFLSKLEYTLRIDHGRRIQDILVPFILWVEMKLKAHASFQALLACITVADVRSQQGRKGDGTIMKTALQLFQCGDETSIALKRRIGEFLDAPIGDEVTKLKRCWTNIEMYFPELTKPEGQILL
jgi:hypothetical protein